MEASLWLNEKSRVSLKVGCLPYMLLGSSRPYSWIILKENGRWTDDDNDCQSNEFCHSSEYFELTEFSHEQISLKIILMKFIFNIIHCYWLCNMFLKVATPRHDTKYWNQIFYWLLDDGASIYYCLVEATAVCPTLIFIVNASRNLQI